MTAAQRVVVAAYAIAMETGEPRLNAEDLVVRCWELWPKDFCMPGYMQHPDAGKMRSLLAHRNGPVAHGWMQHNGPHVWTLTEAGVELVGRLDCGAGTSKLVS